MNKAGSIEEPCVTLALILAKEEIEPENCVGLGLQ